MEIWDLPTALVNGVTWKVITEVNREFLGGRVVSFHLNKIVQCVPRQVFVGTAVAPGAECGCPEVHHEFLRLVLKVDTGRGRQWGAHDLTVHGPCYVFRGPLDCVVVPVIEGASSVDIIVIFIVVVISVTINDICAKWWSIVQRHWRCKLNINFVPLPIGPVWTVPESKEGGHGTVAAGCPDSSAESAILPSFVSFDFTGDVFGCRSRNRK